MNPSAQPAAAPPIAVETWQWELLCKLLRTHLPGRPVWAFGSRVTGRRLKPFSDLDLAIGGGPLALSDAARLADALEESRLPFKVDLVELAALTPEFRTAIEPNLFLIQNA